MKTVLVLIATLLTSSAFATADAVTSVHLVVQHVNDSGDFTVEKTVLVGCYGVAYGPQLTQFTKEYKAPMSVGCGWDTNVVENINYLTCAKVVDSKESSDYSTLSRLTLDISGCEDKNNPKLERAIRKAVKRNFNTKTVTTSLTLIK